VRSETRPPSIAISALRRSRNPMIDSIGKPQNTHFTTIYAFSSKYEPQVALDRHRLIECEGFSKRIVCRAGWLRAHDPLKRTADAFGLSIGPATRVGAHLHSKKIEKQ
jgi:hypothetical protein